MSTKTRTLFFLTIMVIPSLVLAACQPAAQSIETEEPAPSTDSGNSITIIIAEDPPSFNPMVADTGYDALVMELVMLGMTDVDPNGNVFPELAAELPTVENGGVVLDEDAGTMSVTWKMREDVLWQDGNQVRSDDVIFTWNPISDPVNGSWIPGSDTLIPLNRLINIPLP